MVTEVNMMSEEVETRDEISAIAHRLVRCGTLAEARQHFRTIIADIVKDSSKVLLHVRRRIFRL